MSRKYGGTQTSKTKKASRPLVICRRGGGHFRGSLVGLLHIGLRGGWFSRTSVLEVFSSILRGHPRRLRAQPKMTALPF